MKRAILAAAVAALSFVGFAAAPGLSPVAMPDDYTLLASVASDGHAQYVDTGFVPKVKPAVVCGMKVLNPNFMSSNSDPFGTDQKQYGFDVNFDSSLCYRYGNSSDSSSTSPAVPADARTALTTDFTPCAFSNEVWIAGTKLATVSSYDFSKNPSSLFLFRGIQTRYLAVAFSYVKIYDDGELVRDYLPCKDPSGVVGLWDCVERKFKPSEASASLVPSEEEYPCTLVVEENLGGQVSVTPANGNYFGVSGDVEFVAPSSDQFQCQGAEIYELGDGGWTLVDTKTENTFTLTLDAAKRTKVSWQWKAGLCMNKPAYVSSGFSTALISAQVTGIGEEASSATLTLAYGTAQDALNSTVVVNGTAAGEWCGTLQRLKAGMRYYVQATLANDAGDDPVTSEIISFDQPELDEPGIATSSSYVQKEHLVAFWDGYDNIAFEQGDRSATTWKDISGNGFDWTLASGKYEWTDRGLWIKNSGRVGTLQQTGEDFKDKVKTIEFVYANKKNKGASIIFGPGFGSTTYLYTDTNNHVGFYDTKIGVAVDIDVTNCYSVVYTSTGATPNGVKDFRVNGTTRSNDGMNDHWSSGLAEPVLGDRTSGGLAANGELFAIRIYDVELTGAEREQNYKADVVRYLEGRSPVGTLQIVDGQFSLAVPASGVERTATFYWGENYGGTNEWASTSGTVTIPAGATSVSFPKPTGWGSSVWYARAKVGEGDAARWTKTLEPEPPAPLGVETPTRVSSAFGSAVVAAEVTGLGKTASEATLTFSYGTTLDASEYSVSVTVTDIGEWRGTLPHLIGGQTYYVKATLSNTTGDTPVESDVLPLAQPESDERLLPVGYTKVEYVESNGKQYVDTGVDGKSGLECRTKMMWVGSNSDKTYLGARNSTDRIYLLHSYGGWCYGYGAYVNKGTIVNNRAYDVHSKLFPSEQFVEVDGAKVVTGTSASSIDVSRTLYLFAMNSSGSQGASSSARCYSLQIWEQGVLTRDYVPCYSDADKTYGLYDLANGAFSKSATTTALQGPAVSADDRGIRVRSLDTASATLAIAGKATDSTLYRVDGVIGGGEDVAAWGSVTDLGTVAASDAPVERTAALNAGWGESVWMTRFFLVTGSTTNWSDTVIWQDTSKPVVDAIAADGIGGDRIVVTGHLESFPGESCRLYAVVSESEDVLANPIADADSGEITVTETGDFTLTLDDATDTLFVPGSVRYVQVMAVANGKTGASPVAEVRLAGKPVFGTATASISRRTITVTGSLADLGVNPPQTVELWAGDEGALAKVAETTVNTAGESFTLTYAYPLFEHTYQWQLRVSAETANGSPLNGDPTPAANATTLDTTTYTWTGNGENNSWTNSVNWDDGVKGDSLGFPQTTAATAKFTKNADVEIDLPRSGTTLNVGTLNLGTADIDVRFHSSDTNRFGLVLDGLSMAKNIRWTLDHACVRRASDISWPAGVTIVLTNAANLYINNNTMTAGGVTMILADESYLSCYTVYLGNGSTNIINNSTFYTRYDDNLGNKAGEALVRFEGTHPLWWHNNKDRYFYSGFATTAMHFDFLVPEEGYDAAPIQCIATQNKLAGNNNNTKGAGSLTVNVLDESPLAFVRGEHEVPLISWPKSGINTAAFITNNVPHEVPGSEFVWGEGTNPKTLSAKITGYVSSNFILVKSNDEEYNPEGFNANSAYGKHSLAVDDEVTLSAPTAPFDLPDEGERVYVVGWELWSKQDDDSDEMTLVKSSANPGVGEDDHTCKYKHEHYSEFVWLWRHQKRVKVTVVGGEHGSVSDLEQWIDAGARATVTATPETGYAVAWTAGIANERMFDNPLVIDETVDPYDLTAEFFRLSANEGEKTGLFATYAHSMPITFAGYDGTTTLTNFTALIRLAEGDGSFRYNDCESADGRDVRFCDVAGNELDSEVATWDSSGTSEFWVKIPELKGRRTRIYLVWGNANAEARTLSVRAWDKSYRGVWSMEAYRNLTLDRSPWDNHGFCKDELTASVSGVIGKARRFDGTVHGLALVGSFDSSVLKPASFCAECWFRPTAYPAKERGYLMCAGRRSDPLFGLTTDGKLFGCSAGWDKNKYALSALTVSLNEWHHAAYSYDGATGEQLIYLDGECVGLKTNKIAETQKWGDSASNNAFPQIGGHEENQASTDSSNDRYFLGDIDEARVSDSTRNADYVRACYLNVASNANFVVFSGERETLTVDGESQLLTPVIEVSAPESERDGVRRTCTGYAVVADGKLIDSGEGASVSRTWPTNATDVAIAWNWKTEYEVTVNGVSGWYEAGTILPVAAGEAPEGNAFHSWDGDCPKLETFSDSFDLPVDRPRTIAASFAPCQIVVAGEDASENAVALDAAVAAASASGERAVVLVGAGTYENTTVKKLTTPVVVRGIGDGPAKFRSQVTVFNLQNDRSALVGLELYYLGTKNYIAMLSKGAFLDCVFDGLRTQCAYSYVYLVSQSGGWSRRSVYRNSSLNYGGCAIFSRTLVDSCVFTNNTSSQTSTYGCINLVSDGPSRIQNSIIADNGPYSTENVNGGGLTVRCGGCVIENCTIADNWNCGNPATGKKGGGLYVGASSPCFVVNTVFSGNKTNASKEDGDDFYGPIAFVNSLSKEMTGTEYGSSVAQAAFREDDDGTYRPRGTSPSVDAGYPTAWSQTLGAWDFGGTNRVNGAGVDIGAREFYSTGDEELDVNVAADVVSGLDTLTVNFTPTVSGAKGEVVYAWDFGDGTVETNDTGVVSHTYAHAGYYTVVLEVSDGVSTPAVFTGTDLIKVLPSTCYINAAGSHTAPYDTREKGATTISGVLGYAPTTIIVCSNTSASVGYGSRTVINFKTDIIGEDRETSVLAGCYELNHPEARLMNVKHKYSGGAGYHHSSLFVIQGLVSNIVACECRPADTGGIVIGKDSKTVTNARLMDSFVINQNTTVRGSESGNSAIRIIGPGVIVENCVVTNCQSGTAVGSRGAGIAVASGLDPAPIIRNSLIGYNRCFDKGMTNAVGGAGIYAEGPVRVENCTIVSNQTCGAGSAVYVKAGTAEIVNTVIASNVGGMTNAAEICSNEVFVAKGASVTWTKSRVPAEAGIDDDGVTTADPKFNFGRRASVPYWGILGDSPLKNKGVKLDWMTPETKDLGGQKRVFNAKPDLGCYESQVGGTVIIVR